MNRGSRSQDSGRKGSDMWQSQNEWDCQGIQSAASADGTGWREKWLRQKKQINSKKTVSAGNAEKNCTRLKALRKRFSAAVNAVKNGGMNIPARSGRRLCILLYVPAVKRSLQLTAIHTGNTAPMNAILPAVSKAVAAMDKEQFKAEKMYRISLFVAKSMLEKDIISKEEYSEIDTVLLEKYRPCLGRLLAGKPLD